MELSTPAPRPVVDETARSLLFTPAVTQRIDKKRRIAGDAKAKVIDLVLTTMKAHRDVDGDRMLNHIEFLRQLVENGAAFSASEFRAVKEEAERLKDKVGRCEATIASYKAINKQDSASVKERVEAIEKQIRESTVRESSLRSANSELRSANSELRGTSKLSVARIVTLETALDDAVKGRAADASVLAAALEACASLGQRVEALEKAKAETVDMSAASSAKGPWASAVARPPPTPAATASAGTSASAPVPGSDATPREPPTQAPPVEWQQQGGRRRQKLPQPQQPQPQQPQPQQPQPQQPQPPPPQPQQQGHKPWRQQEQPPQAPAAPAASPPTQRPGGHAAAAPATAAPSPGYTSRDDHIDWSVLHVDNVPVCIPCSVLASKLRERVMVVTGYDVRINDCTLEKHPDLGSSNSKRTGQRMRVEAPRTTILAVLKARRRLATGEPGQPDASGSPATAGPGQPAEPFFPAVRISTVMSPSGTAFRQQHRNVFKFLTARGRSPSWSGTHLMAVSEGGSRQWIKQDIKAVVAEMIAAREASEGGAGGGGSGGGRGSGRGPGSGGGGGNGGGGTARTDTH